MLNKQIYIGSTNNLERRVKEHNEGKEKSTKRYMPWNLIYYEAYNSEKLARLREKRLKHNGNAIRELKKRVGLIKNGKGLPSTTFLGNKKSGAGFTLPELLITISIIVILAAAAIPIYGNLQVSSQLNESTSLIIQTLRTAKERSQARVNSDGHGVWFAADSYTLYQGPSYTGRDTDYDRQQTVDSSITIATTLPGGEINFSKSLGEPNNTGTITLTHDSGGERVININSLGAIEEN